MKYKFDVIKDRRETSSIKWDVKPNELPMWVADMDFNVLPEIEDAIVRIARQGALGYSHLSDDFFESYVRWWDLEHGLSLKKSWMVFSNGVVSSLDSLIRRLTKKNDYILILTPAYNCFFSVIKNNGRKVLKSELVIKDNRYEIDFVNFEQQIIKHKPSMFILCNPHNPVGRVWKKDELKKLSNICKKYGVRIISDEIHADLTRSNIRYTSMFSVDKDVILTLSPSKAFNIAGIQSSIVVIKDSELRESIQKGFYEDDIGEPNVFVNDVTVASYNKGHAYMLQLREYLDKNIQEVASFLSKRLPNIGFIKPEGTYLLWLDVSKYTKDIDAFTANLRKKTGLYVSSGSIYGSKNHIRMNIATSLDNVKDGLNRLEQYINSLEKKK